MGGREHEYNRDTQPREKEDKPQSGELAQGEEQKLPSGDAQKETTPSEERTRRKSPFLEALVQMNKQHIENHTLHQKLEALQELMERRQSMPIGQLFNQMDSILEQGEERQETDKERSIKEARSTPNYIAQRAPEVRERLRLEHINKSLEDKNRSLLEENEQLRAENKELAEKVERHLQQARDSYTRQRQENLEEYRAKRSRYMREYRARKKLETESQKPPEEEDDSSQFS